MQIFNATMIFFFSFQWNKGGNRSAADRAKISAGVRARNRAILLEKLKKLGMTEEEWVEKKKQIKYLRERVRRAKVVKDQQLVAEKERELQIALDNNETPGTTVMPAAQPKKKKGKTNEAERKTSNKEGKTKKRRGDQSTVDCEKQRTTMSPSETHQSAQTATVPTPTGGKRSKKESSSTTNLSTQTAAVQAAPQYATFFARDISWTPHQYHESSSQDSSSYEKDCPNGGPGGLICCAACTKKYSSFLSDTTKEIEKQRTHKVNGEVMELLGYLSDAKLKLGTGLQVTKSRTGTGPMQKMITNSKRKAKNTQPAPKTKKKALAPQVRSKKTQKSEPCQAEPLALEDDPFTDKEPLPLLPQPELCSDSPVTLRQPHNGQSQHVISYELPFDNDQSHQGSTGQKCDVEEPEEAIETVAV